MWRQVWDEVAGRFVRVETRRTACDMLRGLLSPIERKNGCWLAEHAGHESPDRIQRLLRTAVCDDQRVRADLREFAIHQLGTDGILVVDDTGYLKKGTRSALGAADWIATETGRRISPDKIGVRGRAGCGYCCGP